MFSKNLYREIKDGRIAEKTVIDNRLMEKRCKDILNMKPFAHEKGMPDLAAICNSPCIFGEQNDTVSFELQVLYPGLYSGMGIEHGMGDMIDAFGKKQKDPDFKVGFAFDYTTGLPYVPGSSVKGALRACFMERKADTRQALCEILGVPGINNAFLRTMETQIFGNRTNQEDQQIQGSVVFYDAFPCEQQIPLMAEDYITPHVGLKYPNPIRTIKIRPGTRMRFTFQIPKTVSVGDTKVTREDIIMLFKHLLIDWGIGAKTNTGYGNLAEI